MKFNTKTVNVSDIKIDESFRQTAPHADKIATCYGFYCEHLFFDRAIIVNRNMLLLDGYVAYLVAKMLDVESVKVVMISGTKEDKAEMIKRPEPAIEPTPESMKLYCVKDYKPGEWCTKGKIYEMDAKGLITFDDGWRDDISCFEDTLIPLVHRPAKVGEWVIPDDKWFTNRKLLNKSPFKVCFVDSGGDVWLGVIEGMERCAGTSDNEYLVLYGYTGE